MNAPRDCPAGHPARGDGQRLRPACCAPLAALALQAFSRVGAWTPPLPPKTPGAEEARRPLPDDARNA
ncbi:hypothetical protein [Pseudorhodoferax sp.]|uniref:hypothetical protein n=1 Tax=Pseudorhodoferax sp. TaxID=1993553 RepID=UPI0039E3805E